MDDGALIALVDTYEHSFRPATTASSPRTPPRARSAAAVLAFYGCSTNSFDKELRATGGYNTTQADILVTNRVTRGGADVAAFMSFLDGLVSQTSAEKLLGGVNKAMRENEHGFARDPWQFTGTRDNPGK